MNDLAARESTRRVIAMVGNPNVGKSTLFNILTGERQRATNFPGTTQEARLGTLQSDQATSLMDLPGTYSLFSNQPEAEICRAVLNGDLAPVGENAHAPDELLLVLDAVNLKQSLVLAAQALTLGLPTRVVLNMSDEAQLKGLSIDVQTLSKRLNCPVYETSARTRDGISQLQGSLSTAENATSPHAPSDLPRDADITSFERWAEAVYKDVATANTSQAASTTLSDRLDLAFTHPLIGIVTFAAVMTGLFWVIFRLAAYPMDWIDVIFSSVSALAESALPDGLIQDLIANGVIAGVGATVIFLPQICLLFFLISILEGTGYLARAAFVVDKLMRPFGLPGHAFVPLLSSHACAIPGIMATRTIPDRKDRFTAILIAPFMSCTARIPVYVLLSTILFPNDPTRQAIAFTGCYVLGALAGLLSAMVARRSILPGKPAHMALELPRYRVPNLKLALRTTLDKGLMFLKKAGVLILCISVVLWWLDAFPSANQVTPQAITAPSNQAHEQTSASSPDPLASAPIATVEQQSYLEIIGSAVQPIMPAGTDNQLSIAILASFAAREVFVTTLAVQVLGSDEDDESTIIDSLTRATRDDGSPLFDHQTSWAMLVFYVLAMQCLPTQVVTARETGSWKWAALQFGWMTALAYAGAFAAYTLAGVLG